MIKIIKQSEEVLDYCSRFICDLHFTDPNHASEKEFKESLDKYTANPHKYRNIGVIENDELIGCFSFLVIPEEKYLEMLISVTDNQEAVHQMRDYLFQEFHGYECFFVYNPRNVHIQAMLQNQGATFDTEQLKMDLKQEIEFVPSNQIVAYTDNYEKGYKAIHQDDEHYWTADQVINCPERFHIFLAVENNQVVGYIDMSHSYDVNEPFDLFVLPEFRRKGYGKALLEKAIETNRPKGMMLHVDIDNIAARNLYESLGFEIDELGCSITARLTL